MVFFSQLVCREILDPKANKVGVLRDFVVDFTKRYPTVTDIVYDMDKKKIKLSWKYIDSIEKTGVFLNTDRQNIVHKDLDEKDILMGQSILDRQVVDITGLKVVRVNDIVLEKIDLEFCITNIDVSAKGILRRLGLSRLNQSLFAHQPLTLIKWENIESLQPEIKGLQLKMSHHSLAQMHPADLADLMENLSHNERAIIFKSLDTEKAADTLEESGREVQKSVIKNLKKERVVKILESMVPDEAADLLLMYPKQRSEELFALMDPQKASVIKNILHYDVDTAGGIMTTEYISVHKDVTINQAEEMLKAAGSKFEHIHHLYVINSEGALVGLVTVNDLIVNKPETRCDEIMSKRVLFVEVDANITEIINLFKRYNLISLPVVNENNKLVGVITSDDILDILLSKR